MGNFAFNVNDIPLLILEVLAGLLSYSFFIEYVT